MPKQIFIHGYLLLDELKISKSLGNAVDPLELIDRLRRRRRALLVCARGLVRPGRQRLARRASHDRYERELGNDLGNLLSRTTAMIARYRDGALPGGPATAPSSTAVIAACATTCRATSTRFDITGAVDRIWVLVRRSTVT